MRKAYKPLCLRSICLRGGGSVQQGLSAEFEVAAYDWHRGAADKRYSLAAKEPMSRDTISAEVKRAVLVEAGHRCAIPTCRATTTEIAHIVPWAETQDHSFENLIALCPNCHTMAHTREPPITPDELRAMLRRDQ